MAQSPNNAELLSAYLDGELTADEQARVEQWLADDPAARRLLDELGAISRMVGQLPDERLGEDLSVAVLEQAKSEILIGRAGSDGQAVTSRQPRGEAKATRREKTPWWHGARRLFGARGLGWSVAAVAVALLVMIVAPEMADRDVAQAPGDRAVESDAEPGDRAEPTLRDEQPERPAAAFEAADEAEWDDKLAESEELVKTEESERWRRDAGTRAPGGAPDAPVADHGPAARRSFKGGPWGSDRAEKRPERAFQGKGGYADADASRPDRPAEPPAPAIPAPAPARGKLDGLAAQGDLHSPAEHDALDVEAPNVEPPMAEQEQLAEQEQPVQQKPSLSFGGTAPVAEPAPGSGQALSEGMGENGKKLGSELSRRMAKAPGWSHRYQTRSAGTEPPMIVRLDITPAAAQAGIVRRVLDTTTLAANQPARKDAAEAAAQSAAAAPTEQPQRAGEDALLDPTSDASSVSPVPDEGGGVEIIPLHTTPDRIAAALTQLRAMPEKVRAISVEPAPGREGQQSLTRFNESSQTHPPDESIAQQQADTPLRQPSSVTQQALPESQPVEPSEEPSDPQRLRRQSEAKQRIAEPSPVLVIVRIVPE